MRTQAGTGIRNNKLRTDSECTEKKEEKRQEAVGACFSRLVGGALGGLGGVVAGALRLVNGGLLHVVRRAEDSLLDVVHLWRNEKRATLRRWRWKRGA